MSPGLLLVVSGPSGVGKTSLIRQVLRRAERERPGQLMLSVSHTTREARQGERDGEDYHFVTPQTFAAMVRDGHFLEHAEIYGEHYGTARGTVEEQLRRGRRVLLEIDWQGAQQIRRSGLAQRSVFILPPAAETLGQRLKKRGLDAPETVGKRIRKASAEMERAGEAGHRITNDDFEQALSQLYCWCFDDTPPERGGENG